MPDQKLIHIEQDVAANYQRLKEERDLTWDQLAAQIEPTDRRLSAWFRQQDDLERTPADDDDADKAPKSRKPTGPIHTT